MLPYFIIIFFFSCKSSVTILRRGRVKLVILSFDFYIFFLLNDILINVISSKFIFIFLMQAPFFFKKIITIRKEDFRIQKQFRKFISLLWPSVINKGTTVNLLYSTLNKKSVKTSKSIFYTINNNNKFFWIIELSPKRQKPDVYKVIRNFFIY